VAETSLSGTFAPSANSFWPFPITTGCTSRCSSSTSSCSTSHWTRTALPVVPSCLSCLSLESSAFTSPLTMVEFSQVASVSVLDTTYFCELFICAVIGSSGSAFGQYSAKPS
jgi:hypothetical protein